MSSQSFWDKTAKFYKIFMKSNNTVYKKSCDILERRITKDMKVLELACGSGQFTEILCDKASDWIATDFSSKMVEEVRKNINKKNVTFKTLDATSTGYSNNTFDAVLIANALHIMPNSIEVLLEIKRILKKQGILIAPTFVYDENIPKVRLFLLEKLGFKTYNKWRSDEFLNFISQNGFTVLECDTILAKPLSECVLIAKNSG